MVCCYLFEAKSIQAYLFSSGKLKDLISASERLDRLIDSQKNSLLYQVLSAAEITSDLLSPEVADSEVMVRFLRCKGGAFYCYSVSEEPLTRLRALWTLTVHQMFPSMEFTDALTSAASLSDALDAAHAIMAADRNSPSIRVPQATAPTLRYQRTGDVSVPMSNLAKRASTRDEFDSEMNGLDVDTELHRQAYQAFEMRTCAALQNKFTPDELQSESIRYPINLETEFAFSAKHLKLNEDEQEATKNIALIHIDGNGLGVLLMALKSALDGSLDSEYRQAFRGFSEALSSVTLKAAKKATKFIYDKAKYENIQGQTMLPLRPVVLGGDDITLLCRADLALEFSQIFCKEFQRASQKALAKLFNKYLKKTKLIQPYLTASGGILFHKAGHPYTNSHFMVEDLCAVAKRLTRSINKKTTDVGPAALAFHRLSNSVNDSFEQLVHGTYRASGSMPMHLGQFAYFVDAIDSAVTPFDFQKLEKLQRLSSRPDAPVAISRWRKMVSLIAENNLDEANRIYHRGIDLCKDETLKRELAECLQALVPKRFREGSKSLWFWTEDDNEKHTFIGDLLVIHHFASQTNSSCDEENKL